MPPAEPFQGRDVRELVKVAEEYWGTRTTWKEAWPLDAEDGH
jgi:hypothetical protein